MAFTKGSPQDFITPKDVSNLKYTNKVFHWLRFCIYVYIYNNSFLFYKLILIQIVEEVIRMANVAACIFRKVDTEVNYKGT